MKCTNRIDPRAAGRFLFGNGLLAHDLAIAVAGLKEIFGRLQDVLTVALAGVMATGFCRVSIDTLTVDMRQLVLTGLCSFASLSLDFALRARLRYFRQESALSPVALRMRPRVGYRLFFHMLVSTALAGILCLPDASLFAKTWLAWWLTLIPAQIFVILGRMLEPSATSGRSGLVVDLWRSRHGGVGALPVISVAAAIVFLTALLGNRMIGPGIASLLTIFLILWYAPIDHAVVTFERIVGNSPIRSVRVRLRIAFAAASGLALAATAALNVEVVAAIAVTALAIFAYKILEILLSRIMGRRQVHLTLAFLVFLILAAILALPWAALALPVAAIAWLAWRVGRTTWMLR